MSNDKFLEQCRKLVRRVGAGAVRIEIEFLAHQVRIHLVEIGMGVETGVATFIASVGRTPGNATWLAERAVNAIVKAGAE